MGKDIKQQVEDLGVSLENLGRSPMESRVFAYLLIAEPPHKTFDEIREFLSASKSAVSNAINSMIKEGNVTYKTYSGDRKRYFMINLKGWNQNLKDSAKNLTSFSVLLNDVLETRADSKHLEFNESIRDLLEFQLFLSDRVLIAIDEWEKR